MTLYASSADRALLASKKIAGDIPRAGDVPAAGPVVLQGMDSIDVTAVGAEIFGLGRAPFAKERSLLNDIGLVIGSSLRLPNRRLREIRGVPNGASPAWWRFVT